MHQQRIGIGHSVVQCKICETVAFPWSAQAHCRHARRRANLFFPMHIASAHKAGPVTARPVSERHTAAEKWPNAYA